MSVADRSPVIVAARRTAIATAGRGFATRTTRSPRRSSPPWRPRSNHPAWPSTTSCSATAWGPGGDVARVALRAGLGIEVPGVTVDRQCGSGLDAVMQAASRVRAGDAALVIAGGAESASTAPHRLRHDTRERYARAPFAPSGFADPDMGPAAEHVARVRGITRARQDAQAARSHARAAAAQAAAFDPRSCPSTASHATTGRARRWTPRGSRASRRRSPRHPHARP